MSKHLTEKHFGYLLLVMSVQYAMLILLLHIGFADTQHAIESRCPSPKLVEVAPK